GPSDTGVDVGDEYPVGGPVCPAAPFFLKKAVERLAELLRFLREGEAGVCRWADRKSVIFAVDCISSTVELCGHEEAFAVEDLDDLQKPFGDDRSAVSIATGDHFGDRPPSAPFEEEVDDLQRQPDRCVGVAH